MQFPAKPAGERIRLLRSIAYWMYLWRMRSARRHRYFKRYLQQRRWWRRQLAQWRGDRRSRDRRCAHRPGAVRALRRMVDPEEATTAWCGLYRWWRKRAAWRFCCRMVRHIIRHAPGPWQWVMVTARGEDEGRGQWQGHFRWNQWPCGARTVVRYSGT